MICQKCGSDISDSAVYCLNCGNPVRQQESDFSDTANDNGQMNSTNEMYPGYPNTSNGTYPGYPNTPNGTYPGYQNTPNGTYQGYPNTPNGTYSGYPNTPNGTYQDYPNTPNGIYSGYPNTPNRTYQGYPNNDNFYPQQNFGNALIGEATQFPMKWYKFLTYVGLPLGILYNLFRAISFFNGSDYGENKEFVYEMFSSLKVIDILSGIWALIAVALAGITVALMLQRKKAAPLTLYGLQIGNASVGVICWLVSYSIVSDSIDIPYMIGYMIGYLGVSAVVFLCNFKYFQKRRHLFVN